MMIRPEPVQGPTATEVRNQVREQIRDAVHSAQQTAREVKSETQSNVTRIETKNGVMTITKSPALPRVPGTPSVPGIMVQGGDPDFDPNIIASRVETISIAFFIMLGCMVVLTPLARAFGRVIERRGQVSAPAPQLVEQLQRIEQAVDTMSVEIERISESQRFLTKLQSGSVDRLGAPAQRG
ncbi:MAG: hypothetical protein H0W68_05895 [Gemmatimonadaceae bacterium]|nr:hypothetical protein [Gemmatimonadaceae bacterium]